MNQTFRGGVIFRPWGEMLVLIENVEEPVTIKITRVQPNERMSLQRHTKRDQFYIFTEDQFDERVTLLYGEDTEKLTEVYPKKDQVFSFPKGIWHRLENRASTTYTFIEVSVGENDEEDIERAEDKYGREGKET
jgi:mannose-6-phosphate isomerase-like protein (cupin superfamily)